MSVLSPALCLLGKHTPLRRRVQWDGHSYVGECRHCRKKIERVAHNNWKAHSA